MEIRVLSIPGRALEYDSTESARSIFSVPESGFLIGPENYALQPAVQWLLEERSGSDHLPVLFYGASGCGKTHLLSGLAESWKKKRRKESRSRKTTTDAIYMPTIDFVRFLSDAIETRTIDDFRKRFRNSSLLALDDIDRVLNKPWIWEELQYTLDELERNGGIAVLSSVTNPVLLEQIPDSLRSRILGGTVLPVLSPGITARTRFLTDLAKAYRVSLSESVLEFAAEKLPYTFPKLYGCFSQIVFKTAAENDLLNDTNFKHSIRNYLNESLPSIDAIAKKVAKHFSLKLGDLRGKSRNKAIALARSIAVYLAKQKTGKTSKEIAEYFGKRDISTIRYLIERIGAELQSDSVLRQHIALLSQAHTP